MNLNITTNLAEVRRRLSGLEKQVNFAASKALNDTAREVRKAIPAGLRRSLDRPTPFTASEGATFVKPAKREDRKISELVRVIVRRHLYGNIGCGTEDFHGANSPGQGRAD